MTQPYFTDRLLKDYTTLKIGGPARRFYEPENLADLQEILAEANAAGADLVILGNGSNMLFEDEGYDGWIVHISEPFAHMKRLENNQVYVEAGTTNEQLAFWLADQGLGGYEFASGIPGTLGGAVIMNAGAYGGELCDVLVRVDYLDETGALHSLDKEELDLGYRHSWFTDHFGVVIGAVLQLEEKDPDAIKEKMADLKQQRWSKQPMDKASAGSTFKRPKQGYASKLIHDNNLQGLRVGDAMVSTKHAGFLINEDQATCKDFLELVHQVQQTVKANDGIDLEMEIYYIPKEGRNK